MAILEKRERVNMFQQLLNKCVNGQTLTVEEAEKAMETMISGEVFDEQIASFLSILHFRGETIEEMIGFTNVMRSFMVKINYPKEMVIDTCGTGGDGAKTFNISTTTAIILSALGVKVAKHGNRSVSSKSGSADVLEYLGMDIQMNEKEAIDSLNKHRLCFLFAPNYHDAMKKVAPIRKKLGFRTIFNLLGPLLNPTMCQYQLMGIYDTKYAEKIASVLDELGTKRACIVTGEDGLDECSIAAGTHVVELKDGQVERYMLYPEDVGLSRGSLEDIKASSPKESAEIMENIFLNRALDSQRDIVVLNSGMALYVKEYVSSIEEGVRIAKDALASGKVYCHFQKIIGKEQLYA